MVEPVAVKAGPKKRRAKSEEQRIREAVAEHGARGKPRTARKSGKVRSFTYKESDASKRAKVDRYLSELQRIFGMRTPRHENEYLEFLYTLKADEHPFALQLFRMTCTHPKVEVVANGTSMVHDNKRHIACVRCGLVRVEQSKTKMLIAEWQSYCPTGFDMFDWEDLFTKDKSMWRFLHDECLAEMVEESMTEED